jgi:hypothetical protein
MTRTPQCAVCSRLDALTGVVIGGEVLFLCEPHADKLGSRTPSNFSDLARLFADAAEAAGLAEANRGDGDAPPDDGEDERRGPRADRRVVERRQFPPRPEGRRHNDGRRDDDLD